MPSPWLTLGVVSLLWATASVAQDNLDTSIIADNPEDTYERCVFAAQQDPETGMAMAVRWKGLNGGEPADHCQAVAILALGDVEDAAARFEALADQSTATAPVKAGLYAQAAQAWMDVAAYDRALTTLNKSMALRLDDTALLIDRAITYAALNDFWSAIDDLNRVLDADPNDAAALVLRSSAYRRLGIADLANDDVERALAIAPDNIDALLERGLLAKERGDKTAARLTWIKLLEIAPDSAAADAVRSHLEEMDVVLDP